jgi:hypothetical protein
MKIIEHIFKSKIKKHVYKDEFIIDISIDFWLTEEEITITANKNYYTKNLVNQLKKF